VTIRTLEAVDDVGVSGVGCGVDHLATYPPGWDLVKRPFQR
jgi:hypothetical protein